MKQTDRGKSQDGQTDRQINKQTDRHLARMHIHEKTDCQPTLISSYSNILDCVLVLWDLGVGWGRSEGGKAI